MIFGVAIGAACAFICGYLAHMFVGARIVDELHAVEARVMTEIKFIRAKL